jgi:cytochrome c553
MIRYCTLIVAVCASAFAANAGAAEAGDAEAGRNKAAMCQGCHGIEGYRMAFPEVYSVPRLGGQHQAYIVKALNAYKSGTRSNATMRAIASGLSDKDMANLAAYYGSPDVQTAAK